MNENSQNERYFAAANSYNGFISYFDKIFDSGEYDRIYVLKGGPGTGKSSLMKKISKEMTSLGCECREILCSSDPKSLDGIIIYNRGKKIAILDGTAPHERDAKIPGAVDEIVNLGSCWEPGWLRAKRDMIEQLCREKSRSYSTAYSYLKIAGAASDFIYSVWSKNFDENKAKIKAEAILSNLEARDNADTETLLISSFGKDGEGRLNTFEEIGKSKITVGNNRYLASLFLNECCEILRRKNISFIHLPQALAPQYTDCIFICENGIFLCYDKDGDINTDEISSVPSIEKEQIKCAEAVIEIAKEEARRWFAIASDFHFRLEEIYSQAMNFEKIDCIVDEKMKEIRLILDL